MTRRIAVLAAALASACGGGGTLTGTVTVQGGSAANVAVFVYGATSTAAVTSADGRFVARGLPDGDYSVLARVRGADVEEVTVPVRMTGGKPETEPTLAFTLSSGTVTGRLVFADASSAANVTITLSGATARGTRTAGDGAFTFSKVPPGAYVVSVDLLDTRERRASVGVAVAGGPQDVGELRLTPVGRLTGSVSLNGTPAEGATVSVAGTPLVAQSDALGRFAFPEVAAGEVTVVAAAGAQQQLAATTTAQVTRGGTADVSLTLADAQGRRGTVRGVVTFTSPQSPTIITVTVPGTGATAMADANGAYSLQVPAGEWDVVARAPYYPAKVLGRARVLAGQTTRLEGAELSWFRPILETAATLSTVVNLSNSANTPWLVFRTSDAATLQRTYLFNSDSLELRLLANSSVTNARFSANAKYVAFQLSGELMVHQIGTGAITTWGTGVSNFDFSSSEAFLFIVRGGALERVNLTTTAVTRFPAMGSATQLLQHTNDRWLVRDSSNDVTLVEPTVETAQVFTGVQTMQSFPTPWALTSCMASCTLKVLPATARAAVTVTRSFAPATSVQLSPADYPSYLDGTTYVIVRASDGTFTALPPGTNRLQFSPDGKRYAFQTTSAGTTTIREEALPPTATAGLVAQSTAALVSAYLSNSRFVALEQVAPRRIFDGKATGGGPINVTIDNDVDAVVSAGVVAPLLVWPKASTGKWNVTLGDKAPLALPVDFTVPPASVAVRGLGADGPTEYATMSFDGINTWVIDAKLGQVRKLPGGSGVSAERSRMTEFFVWQRPGGPDFVTFGPEIVLSLNDPGIANGNSTQANGERGVVAVSQDRHHVSFGVVRP